MRCEKVLGNLSLFLDGMLEDEPSARVVQHLRDCSECNREFARLRRLQDSLRKLQPVQTPAFLRDLVEIKIRAACRDSWRSVLRSAFEYRWSKIRTTEGMWYLTRLSGVMATVVMFIAICASVSPMNLEFVDQLSARGAMSQTQRSQQLGIAVLGNLGITSMQAQKIPISPSGPKINDLNMVNFGQSAPGTAQDDTVSVVAIVDRSGAAKIQDILEYPVDESLLSAFAEMIMSANWRPASRNGRAVDSQLVLTFSRVYVSN
jgi:hypothetical protein